MCQFVDPIGYTDKIKCIWRDIEVVITGLTRKRLIIVTKISPRSLEALHFFGILSADFSEVGRQFSIKIPTIKYVQYASWRDISPAAIIR